ncbi:MAG: tripartite tricarboxylate transporter substrate binding protein [Acidovorax sp.]
MATCVLAALCGLPAAHADSYPSHPIRIVVHSAAGALLDVTTRVVAQKMAEDLGQPVIIDNRAGADGLVGIRYAKSVPADGYTLLAASNTVAQLPAFRKAPGYDLDKDFTGIGMMNRAPLLLVGTPSQPDRTLAALIASAKAKPGQLIMAHAGKGTSTHMAAALFFQQTGAKFLDVPYKGNAAAIPDVVGGRVNAIFDGGNSSGPLIKEGKLRAFGITSASRSAAFPEIPTLAEQGLPQYSFYVYLGLLAPAGTPKDVVQRLSKALQAALASDAVKERLRSDGAEAGSMSPDEFTKFLKEDAARTQKVVADLGYAKE